MMRVYTGFLGSGKTLSMVAAARERVREDQPQIYTNMASLCFPESAYVSTASGGMIRHLESALLIFDEIHLSFDAQFWQQVEKDDLRSFTMLRKNGVDLYCTTQVINQVASRLRSLINEEVYCRKVGPIIIQTSRVPERKEVLGRRFVRIPTAAYRLYDTFERPYDRKAVSLVRSQCLESLRADRLTRKRQRVRPELTSDWYKRPVTRLYDKRLRLTRQAQVVYDRFVSEGVFVPGARGWRDEVGTELMRRAWLWDFGFRGTDCDFFPASCTHLTPWVVGGSPAEVAQKDWEDRSVEQVVERLDRRNREAIIQEIRSVRGSEVIR